MNCEVCGEEIKHSGRGRAPRFCSGACRAKASRTITQRTIKTYDKEPEKQAENFLEDLEIISKSPISVPHVRRYELPNNEGSVEMTPENCQKLVNEGVLNPSHLNLGDWGFEDPAPGVDSYFFPKKFKSIGKAQLKCATKGG